MRRSIATVSLSGTLEEKLTAAAQVGFDGVEIFESDLINCASSPAELRARAADLGLRIELYQPFRDAEGVGPEQFAANLRRARAKFALMAELGVDTLLACSNVSPTARCDDDLSTNQLYRLADLAGDYGVRIAYEALAWGRHVDDYRHAWRLVAAADHPRLGVCLDSFHILSRGHDPAGIREIPGDKIFFLQLADAPLLLMDVLQWSRHYRCFPGQGSFDLAGFLGHVLAAGYRGPLSLEVFNDVFRQADAERTATDAMRSLIALQNSLVASQNSLIAFQKQLEPAPDLDGYAFVEIGVDPLGEIVAERMLGGLGFTRVGRHRTKPVHLWEHGSARILLNRTRLNRTRPARDDWQRGDAAVTAVAVESRDPGRSARRAAALLAPAVPRRYGPGEADLTAISAPDGTSVFFCRSEPTAGSWLGDFESLPPVPAHSFITGVDHVALSQPSHYFDEAALFYQSVLGLRHDDPVEIADPYGLVRSRAVTGARGAVRLVLNVPALGGGPSPESAEFQHIAFACTDIFVAVEAVRAAGIPLLPIPANYYADLAARVDLDEAAIAAMRSCHVLYDRTDEGEFYHFYTAMLGRRMFFEMVQRVTGYDGYGTPNTPVRMASQYRHTAMAGLD